MALTLEQNEKARRLWFADISHELRTPLAVLIGETEGLLEGIREITPEAVRSLHGEALRLNHLVDDLYQLALLDLGKLTYHKETFDLTGLIDSVIETFAPQSAAKGIALSRDLPQAPWKTVHADRQRLRQMLVNLFDNSLKYTDPGGAIMVRLLYTDGRAVIELEDSAPGVPCGQLERLFDRLYRVEGSRSRASGGAGLGLAICKSIVEAHDGAITARQSSLGGLLIRVVLPLASRRP